MFSLIFLFSWFSFSRSGQEKPLGKLVPKSPNLVPRLSLSSNHSMAEGTDCEESKRNVNSFQVAVIGAGLSGTGFTRYIFIAVIF